MSKYDDAKLNTINPLELRSWKTNGSPYFPGLGHPRYQHSYSDNNHLSQLRWAGYHSETGRTKYIINETVMNDGELLRCAVAETTATPRVESDDWELLAYLPNKALIHGAPANFSPGSSFTPIQNWPDFFAYGRFFDNLPIPATGIITLPAGGEYRITTQIVFEQGNSNKELAAILWLRSSVTGDTRIDALQISDDKTAWRSMGAVFTYDGQAAETLQLGLSWVNQTMGTVVFDGATFEAQLELPIVINETQRVASN